MKTTILAYSIIDNGHFNHNYKNNEKQQKFQTQPENKRNALHCWNLIKSLQITHFYCCTESFIKTELHYWHIQLLGLIRVSNIEAIVKHKECATSE